MILGFLVLSELIRPNQGSAMVRLQRSGPGAMDFGILEPERAGHGELAGGLQEVVWGDAQGD